MARNVSAAPQANTSQFKYVLAKPAQAAMSTPSLHTTVKKYHTIPLSPPRPGQQSPKAQNKYNNKPYKIQQHTTHNPVHRLTPSSMELFASTAQLPHLTFPSTPGNVPPALQELPSVPICTAVLLHKLGKQI